MNVNELSLSTQFPELTALRLDVHELKQLSQQGVLRQEQSSGKAIYKIRFRCDGRQRVKRVRPDLVSAVRAELETLQAATHLRRELKRVTRAARSYLRETKVALAPFIETSDYYFHGYEIRRYRHEVAIPASNSLQ
jgi:hypothetical protein